jgi:hypothetical protein
MVGKGAGGRNRDGERKGEFRVPAIVVLPLCIGICWLFAGWPGAIVGAVAGFFLWRSRA